MDENEAFQEPGDARYYFDLRKTIEADRSLQNILQTKMTEIEKHMANGLKFCTFLPGSFDKRFVKQLDNWIDREMTTDGRSMMVKLYHKYRRQISNYNPNLS
jgi:hypothetical protein